MKKKFALCLAMIICMQMMMLSAFAQDWVRMMQDPNVNFYDVQKEFSSFQKKKERDEKFRKLMFWKIKEEEAEDDGYMLYKRWEWFTAPRVYPTGERFNPSKAPMEFQRYLSENNSSRDMQTGTTGNWTLMGPAVQLCAGRTNFIRMHPTDPNIIFIGAAGGGLWKTVDGGTIWSTNTDNLPTLGTADLAFDPTNSNTMYLVTGDIDHADQYSVGLLKSTDGGTTWNPTGLSYQYINKVILTKILVNPTNPNIILVGSYTGIWRSADGGTTWTQTSSTNKFFDLKFKPGDPSVVYAASASTNPSPGTAAYYRSSDGGISFMQITSGVPASSAVNRMTLAVTPADPNYVYLVASSSSSGFYGLFLSTDGGMTFTQKSSSPNIVGNQGWFTLPLAVSPVNKNEVLAGGFDSYRSTDGGVTWVQLSNYSSGTVGGNYVHADHHDLEFSNDGTAIYSGNDAGIYKTVNNGTNWANLTYNGIPIGQPYSIGISQTNPALILSGLQDNGTTVYNGTTWSKRLGGDGCVDFIDWSDETYQYATAPFANCQRSINAGASFSAINTGLPSAAQGNANYFQAPFLQDPNVSTTIYVGKVNVWKSIDRGTTWAQISNFGTTDFVNAIAVAPSNSNYIYCTRANGGWGPRPGTTQLGGTLLKTTNGGTAWTDITAGLPVTSAVIIGIAVKNTDPNKLWVALSSFSAGNKVFESSDGGTTWTNISGSLPNLPVTSIVYQKGSPDGLYIGMDIGVYYKDTTLSSWQLFNTGLPNVFISQLGIQYSSGKLRAATFGRGNWQSDLYSTTTSVTPVNPVAEKFNVYPNPGDGHFTITFNAPKGDNYFIEVYDEIGKLIYKEALNDIKGEYTHPLDLTDFGKGIYMINMGSSSSIKMTQKIVVY